MAAGGANPITGDAATNTERFMWGVQGLLNAWGLGSTILSTGYKVTSVIDQKNLDAVTSHPNAHSLERHGGAVTDGQLMYRAVTGEAPDGHVKIVNGKTMVNLGRGFERLAGSKLNPSLQGAPSRVQNLRSVQATYEFNSASKVWETITIFSSR